MTAALLWFVLYFLLAGLAGFGLGVLFGVFVDGRATMRCLSWLAVLLLLALLTPNPANAAGGLRIEVGVSRNAYSVAGDNIWYDERGNYPYANDLRALGGIVGASGDWPGMQSAKYGVGWRVWLIDFSRTSNSAVWPSDEDYFAGIRADPIYRGRGHGSAYGLSLAPSFDYRPAAGWTVSVEGGFLLYRASWSEQVQKLDDSGKPVGNWFDVRNVDAGTGADNDWTIYMGLTVRWRRVFASYRKYRDVHGFNSLFGGTVKQAVVGVSVPFSGGGGGW